MMTSAGAVLSGIMSSQQLHDRRWVAPVSYGPRPRSNAQLNRRPTDYAMALVAEVRRLLSAARLVTLTGVGGVGKSRLAMRVAAQAWRSFPNGVWLTELAALHDPSLVNQAISNALGIVDQSTRDQLDVLVGFLAERRLLLVIDNCEHLVDSCAATVAELLRAAPRLHVLG